MAKLGSGISQLFLMIPINHWFMTTECLISEQPDLHRVQRNPITAFAARSFCRTNTTTMTFKTCTWFAAFCNSMCIYVASGFMWRVKNQLTFVFAITSSSWLNHLIILISQRNPPFLSTYPNKDWNTSSRLSCLLKKCLTSGKLLPQLLKAKALFEAHQTVRLPHASSSSFS